MTCNINCIYKSGEYICAFSKKLNGQRSTRSFCDVVLVAEEVVFPAHRSVLAAATEYFQVMFNINMTEKTQSRIHLSGASSDALGRLLDYIYTGSLHITKESVVNLIFLSSLLMMFDVAEYCWKYFLGSLDIQNCVERKMLADSISCEEVSKRVTAFVLKNFARLDAKALVTCPVNVMSELLSHEDLFVEKELEALKVLLEWCTHDLSGREKVAKNLLNSVRFSFLSLSQESLETLLRNYGISRGSNIYDLILKRAETNCGLLEARLSYKEERVIFVAGGHGENSILNQVTGYVPSSGKWYELSEMNYPRRR